MNLYKISLDSFDYQEVDLKVTDFLEYFPEEITIQDANQFDRLNLSLGSFWPDIRTDLKPLPNSPNLIPNITMWRFTSLAICPTAFHYIGQTLKPYGELLPLIVNGNTWHLFNCTSTGELDVLKSKDNSLVFQIESMANKPVFKCIHPQAFGLYCNENFKQLVTEFGLNGLSFEPLAGRS